MKKINPFLVIDIESTCWKEHSLESSEIIEIGICVLSLENLTIEANRSLLVKPLKSSVSQFCTDLTTLTQETLSKEGIGFQEACSLLEKEYHSKSSMWGSWGDYDRNQFQQVCKRQNVRYPFGPSHINIKSFFSAFYGLKKELGMNKALQFCDLPLIGTHHRGIHDAYNIARILQRLLKKCRGGRAGFL